MVRKKPRIRIVDRIKSLEGHDADGRHYSFIPKESFAVDGRYFGCVQTDAWEGDAENWDNLYFGRWAGGKVATELHRSGYTSIITTVPSSVRLSNEVSRTQVGPDPVVLARPGNHKIVFSITHRRRRMLPEFQVEEGHLIYEVVDTMTGLPVHQGIMPMAGSTVPNQFTPVFPLNSEGNYIARVKIRAEQNYVLPPGYEPPPEFLYLDSLGNEWAYDPYLNIGKLPMEYDHPLRVMRRDLLAAGETTDKPEWIIYLSGFGPADSEWSQIKIVVRAENSSMSPNWDFDSSKISSVGPVLFYRTSLYGDPAEGEDERTYVCFDPLARSITASRYVDRHLKNRDGEIVCPKGSYLIAGNRSCDTGALLALWLYVPPSVYGGLLERYTLLGLNPNPSTDVCECALVDHGATDIKYTLEGDVYVLTKCSLHLFIKEEGSIDSRLPGVPVEYGGHPGGQALNLLDNKIYFFSEYFDFLGDVGHHFYNYMVYQNGDTRGAGEGTVFHGPNCATTWMNMLIGIYQNKAFDDPVAQQYIAHFDGQKWARKRNSRGEMVIDSSMSFSAQDYNWQRVVNFQNVLHIFGKRGKRTPTIHEEGIFAVHDGISFHSLEFTYRVTKATIGVNTKGEEVLLVIAHEVIDSSDGKILDLEHFYILEMDYKGDEIVAEWDPDESCFIAQEKGVEDIPYLYPYLEWDGRAWVGVEVLPTAPGIHYLELVTKEDGKLGYCYQGTTDDPNAEPPGDPETCPVIIFRWNRWIRGRFVNGEFVSCDPKNAGEAYVDMPPGTKYKVVPLERHGAPLNVIELVDTNVDMRLKESDKHYYTTWYRERGEPLEEGSGSGGNTVEGDSALFNTTLFNQSIFNQGGGSLPEVETPVPSTEDELIAFLETFNKNIRVDDLAFLEKENLDGLEIVVLFAPELQSTTLPLALRII